MFASVVTGLLFLQEYIIPVVFAIGVIFFLYGFLNSFLLSRPDLGQPYLIRSVVFFTIALICYGILGLLIWLLTTPFSAPEGTGTPSAGGGARIDRTPSTLPTPNAPEAR